MRYQPPPANDKPRFSERYKPGIIGCGGMVKAAHLPAYNKYGLRVVGDLDGQPVPIQGGLS
jgi:predicted dehydrogenase